MDEPIWERALASGDAAAAVAGIDAYLGTRASGAPGTTPLAATVHLHCTDVDGEWLVSDAGAPGAPLEVRRQHAKGDAAIRGRAQDLLALCCGRVPLDGRFEVFGDVTVVERFLALVPDDQ